MAGRNRAGLKRVIKTVKSKKGTARRTYWVKSDPKKGKVSLRHQGLHENRPGFVRRHAGKILAGAALVGALAYGNRHALKRAHELGSAAHRRIKSSGESVRAVDHAKAVFGMARLGFREGNLRAAQNGSRFARANLSLMAPNRMQRATAALGRAGSRAAGVAGRVAKSEAARAMGGQLFSTAAGAAGTALLGPMGGTVASMAADHFGGHLVRGATSLASAVSNRWRNRRRT